MSDFQVSKDMDNNQALSKRWYYLQGGVVSGPVSFAELLQAAAQGFVHVDTLVAPEGSEDWQPYASVASAEKNAATTSSLGMESTQQVQKEQTQASAKAVVSHQNHIKRAGLAVLLLGVGWVLWQHWRFWLTLGVFLGVWYGFAKSNLSAKRSRIHSVGGGLILGLLAMMFLRSCVLSEVGNSTADSASAHAKGEVGVPPIFQHEAAASLKQLKEQVRKFEALVRRLNSDQPLPNTVEGYARLTTTQDIRSDSQAFLDMLSKRLAALQQLHQAANGYAKVAFEVERGFQSLLLAVADLEVFANDLTKKVEAARAIKNHLSATQQAINSAEEIYHETSTLAGIELVPASAYQNWFDKLSQTVDACAALWKEVDQGLAAELASQRLASLRSEGQALCASYDHWLSEVRQKENSLTDADQMDRLIQHDDLEEELSAICVALEDVLELELSQDRQDRVQVIGFMRQRLEDARRQFR